MMVAINCCSSLRLSWRKFKVETIDNLSCDCEKVHLTTGLNSNFHQKLEQVLLWHKSSQAWN
jgi:hypothetical protein